MQYGLAIFPTEYSIAPTDLAREAEARGFESIWVAEHTHIPACRRSPWPGGGELPQEYYDVYDPFVALAAMAAVTTRLKLGTGISLVVEHDPIYLAKQVATLDQVSQGRFLFGVGGGWNAEEMENHGTPFNRRWKVMRERIEAMKEIWTKDRAEYHGEFVAFDPIVSNPKPAQKPYPPIHVGGAPPHGMRRAVHYGDGWIPIGARGDEDPAAFVPELRRMAREAGRDPDAIEVSMYGVPGSAKVVEHYRAAGVARSIFFLRAFDRERALSAMDRYAKVMEEVA